MTIESALLSTFRSDCTSLLGKAHSKLGPKAEALLMDVKEINRLIYILLNSNCITFYEAVLNLRETGSGFGYME